MGSPAAAKPPSGGDGGVAEIPLRFTVRDSNTSAVECESDARRDLLRLSYEVSGWLVAPRSALSKRDLAVTLYLHGYGGGHWRFKDVPGYDFAGAMARLGHISVVIDRVGYGVSQKPFGFDSCLGAQADMAHQIVGQLRKGSYQADLTTPIAFGEVAIAGHSIGGGVAELEAYSYRDVDALVTLAHADSDFSPQANTEFARTEAVCATGGEDKYKERGEGPAGYAYFPTTDEDTVRLFYFNVAPEVLAKVLPRRERDPCGDLGSFGPTVALNQLRVKELTIPVLLGFGENDAVFGPGVASAQAARYERETGVTSFTLPDTGHIMMLEQTAPQLRSRVHAWLADQGF